MSEGFLICFPLDEEGTHISLVIRIGCPNHDLAMLRNLMDYQIKHLLPLQFKVDKEITMKGPNLDVPTHSVHFYSPHLVHEQLADMYRTFYMVPEGETAFPDWSAHVTVKKEAAQKTIDRILKYQGGIGVVGRVELRIIGDASKESIYFVALL